jgi:hypothetical protein
MAAGSITGGQATAAGAASPASLGDPASAGLACPPPHPPMRKPVPSAKVAKLGKLAKVAKKRRIGF